MARPKSPLVWILIAVGGASALCCTGTLGLLALGLIAGDDTAPGTAPSAEARTHAGRKGEPGGFAFDAPQGWKTLPDGRFIIEYPNKYGDPLGVEALRMPSVPGLDDGEGKVVRLWRERVGADWNGVPPHPRVMRRFMANGARAFFATEAVKHKGNGRSFLISLYLVEADDRFEPLVFIQSFASTGYGEDLSASFSWDTSYAKVEEALKGVRGSPVGLPLVDDAEVVGRFQYSSNSATQYVNTFTGATTMSTVSYGIDFTFGKDHTFQYKFVGASGQVGAMNFGADDDQGAWSVKHDVLTVTGAKRTRRYLLIGAARTPEGRRALYMLPEHPSWSLAPGSVAQHGELYVSMD
ncbi:hypothetical protein G4177_22560 [Corallococcus sp. ZKHCc1 1396]|uniref:Uncharacterized protein n=1 Tax=Corallococcus soli TaxID=2710757 RepID=A0ABR9PSQ8_9BACT|nr:hypothetical protein [Corallococcus soli]MBE4750958.1 hypothetical protein [Corallococcus soli]